MKKLHCLPLFDVSVQMTIKHNGNVELKTFNINLCSDHLNVPVLKWADCCLRQE